jgi:hypothetical protein
MKKIAIKFLLDEYSDELDLKKVSQQLQRFIIEEDYKLSTIYNKVLSGEIIALDIGMEDAMPLFEDAVDEFDEIGLNYLLYIEKKGEWRETAYEDLARKLDRTPRWLHDVVEFNLLWFVVMTMVQFFPIYKFYDEKYDMGLLLTLLSSFLTGLIPIVNSILAYFGATEFYDWKPSSALFAFFGYYLPLVVFILYLIWLIAKGRYSDKWYRFWRPEFN